MPVTEKPLNYKEIAKQEYLKCSKDPQYFIQKYVYIQMTNGGRGKFILYEFQKKLLHIINTRERVIILKSRQLGITTLCAAYSLWLMIFTGDQLVLAVAPDHEKAKSILNKIIFAYDEVPDWMLTLANAHSTEKNKTRLSLENGSSAVATSGAGKAARGKTATFLVLDEMAYLEEAIEVWGSSQQTLSSGGSAVLLSTPNGVDNLFHQLYSEAELGENNFIPVKLKWDVHPDRDQAWRDRQDKELGSKRMAEQECFEGDTRIYTKQGLRKISEIEVGDEVLTHLGRFNKVTNIYVHGGENLCQIRSSINRVKRIVTSNHPFLFNNKWSALSDIPNKSMLPSFFTNNILPTENKIFNVSSAVTPNFFKLIEEGENIYINDRKHKKRFPKHVTLDYEFGQILGLYLAEGSKVPNRVTFSFNYKTELNDWVEHISKVINERYKISPKISKKLKGAGNLDFCSQIFSQLIDAFVDGDYCYYKKLSAIAYDNMSIDMAKGIVNGFFKGDGCILEKYRKRATTTSEDLSYDILYLLKTLGYSGITYFKTEGKAYLFKGEGTEYQKATNYTIGICNSKDLQCTDRNVTTILDDRIATKPSIEVIQEETCFNILHKNKYTTPTIVYNLEVEEDHTYITEHFIVHNCDAEFLTSGNTYIDSEDLKWVRENTEEPIEMRGATKELWVWLYPEQVGNCVVILDTSRGDGEDSAGLEVLDLDTGDQVAEYKGGATPKELAELGVRIAMEYNNALIIVENTGIGNTTCSYVVDSTYPNIFYSPKSDTLDVHEYLDKYYDKDKEDMTCGFTNSTRTRPVMLDALRQRIIDKVIRIRSKRLSAELHSFVWKNGKAQAAKGHHDDLVLPTAIGVFLRDTAISFQTQGMSMQRAVLGGIRKTESVSPIYSSRNRSNMNTNPFMYRDPKTGIYEDISWLVR